MLHLLGCRAASTVTFLGRDYQDYNHSDRKWKVLCCSWSKLTDNSVVAGRNQSVSLEMEPRITNIMFWLTVPPATATATDDTQFNIVRSASISLYQTVSACLLQMTTNSQPVPGRRLPGSIWAGNYFFVVCFCYDDGGGGGGGCTCN